MTAARLTLAALLALACSAAAAETVCVKGNKPGDCFELQPIPGAHDTPPATQPSQPAGVAIPAATPSAVTSAPNAASASAATTIGGDTVRSTVAVFPGPSTAVVPAASSCIVTHSTAGGIGWNLIHGATSKQYSDPVCVLQWLLIHSHDPMLQQLYRAEIWNQVVGNQREAGQ